MKKIPALFLGLSVTFFFNINIAFAKDELTNAQEDYILKSESNDESLESFDFEENNIVNKEEYYKNLESNMEINPVKEDLNEENSKDFKTYSNDTAKDNYTEKENSIDFKEIYYYQKIDLDKNYLGSKFVETNIGRDLILIKEEDKHKYKDKWVKIGKEIHYINNKGEKVKGFFNEKNDKYFFTENGLLTNDELADNSGIYEIDNNGKLSLLFKPKKGWNYISNKSYYYNQRGEILKGLQVINDNRYVFNLQTGQVEKDKIVSIGNQKYYSQDDGIARRIGWDYFNGHFSYVQNDGSYSKGLTEVSNRHYFFSKDGDLVTDSNRKVNNQWWYFDFFGVGKKTDGRFKTGWHGDYYYFKDGKRAQGYQKINGKLYYFDDRYYNIRRNFNGAFDFKRYYFGNDGVGRYVGEISKKRHSSGTDGFKKGQTKNAGRLTPYYNQRDYRWANRSFAQTGSDFKTMGCGSTSMAMALSRVKKDSEIYPTTVSKDAWYYTNTDGTEWAFVKDEAIRYGLKAYRVPINHIALVQALSEGPVVIRVGPGYFTDAGHFMVLDSYNNGYFYLNDPYNWNNTIDKYTFNILKQSTTTAWIIK